MTVSVDSASSISAGTNDWTASHDRDLHASREGLRNYPQNLGHCVEILAGGSPCVAPYVSKPDAAYSGVESSNPACCMAVAYPCHSTCMT